ncbi:protein SIEVE ELEMENT OCCLUSION B-like [Senna tora]|uniref:Protein SIEVE ELEMENT OCCLUSION B-like n=1 Tax=Senna tora TaxID=362788 RepID=A0A834X378_9FABA|nr:protein SIEVE ELEMENT OCCLUSION B-like [Senna tora]
MAPKLSLKSLLQGGESEHNPLTMSDEQILEQIYSTHVHTDTKFDVDSLFTLVDNTLRRSTHIVDNVVQGSQQSSEQVDDKIPQLNFSSPLCTLRQISAEMSCKPPGEEIAHKTTVAILNKLSKYEWDAKAVITVAAFAVEYGEFWLLAQLQPTDLLAKSVGVLKRVPLLTRPASLQKHRQPILELNNLVKATLQVIQLIFDLEKLTSYDTKDVPALIPAIEQIPVDVYWSIITVVAIVTQIDCLTTDSEHRQELSHYGQKINVILSKLRKQITLCRQQIAEAEYYRKLRKLFQTPTEVMEVFKVLIFSSDAPQPLFDGATKTTVKLEVLRKKNVYLLISTLEITEEEIWVIQRVYEGIKTKEQYKMVWIPVVEEWTEQLRKKLEVLKARMPWYVVQVSGGIAGYKYIKEEWHFKKKPTVVAWGMKAFPFTTADQDRIHDEINWVGPIVRDIHPTIATWMKEEKYIFFYGGKEKEWIQQFTKYATALANDAVIKEAKISIELFCVEKEDKNLLSRFWSGIESLFVTKVHKTVDAVTQEVQKMLSYKNETGWALVSKGSSVILSGHGTTILKTVAEFEKWKEIVIKRGFEVSFKEYHDRIVRTTHRCSHLEIPNVAGKLPDTIKCPDCPKTMEIFISYKCCHNQETVSLVHHKIHHMATLRRSIRSLLRREDEDEQNPLAISDQDLLHKVFATHLHSDTKFDAHSLFIIVQVILQGSTHIVDNVLQGTHENTPKAFHQNLPHPTFTYPLCTLKEISSQMCCKPPGLEIAHGTTMSILNLLSDYSWDAKAVLTLAAFALEYGEFWWLSQLQPTDALAKSVAILKRVSVLTKPAAVREHFLAIYEINNLIKTALQVIEAIFELQKFISYETIDVSAVTLAMDLIPLGVYWATITVVACVAQIDCLTTDS